MKYESIINKIFNEAECMAAHIIPSGEEYSAAAEEMKIAEQKLLDTFSKTQEGLFDEYESAVCDVGTFEDTETFRYSKIFRKACFCSGVFNLTLRNGLK